MIFDTVIGLEVHAELSTKTKIFCSCSTEFGGKPNTHVCPVCLGLPGTLPVLNKVVVEYCIKAGLALNCTISKLSKLDRKNYFYPDLPKAYQISQYDMPLCKNGYIILESGKKIRLNRIHIEEDAGKLIHSEDGDYSLVDYNRTGVPLIEIVSEPDMASPDEALEYMEKLKGILEYIDVSDCKMQEGSLRCDANISIKPEGSNILGTKTELKNINSFKALHRALCYEQERQQVVIEDGGKVIQQTRRWDEPKQKTLIMRGKEQAQDYRYFPDPDLVPIAIDDEYIQGLKSALPDLPKEKRRKFIESFGLPEYDAGIITSSKYLAEYFEGVNEHYYNPKAVSNFIMGELMRLMKEADLEYKNIPVKAGYLGDLLKMIDDGKISVSVGKRVFEEMFKSGKKPLDIVNELGLMQISDKAQLAEFAKKAIEENPKSVEDYLSGKGKAVGFLIGQVMRKSKGKANPTLLKDIILQELKGLKR
ncbi:MAG: Asp-tRNA(Asn)/Glu-tRNA(Gln) amidotransferase subunit GatB [Clostridiales bacterium]|nr:Asp-tRNA(Asn)/Glu-tRNA(Gln) amidotransferase subunit GatB [Clostridiales bacterium]